MMRKKKYMSFDDAFRMVEKVEKPEAAQATGISLKDFTQLYAISKMVVVDESTKGLRYLRTQFLEMVELIGRLTIFKNFNTQLEDLPMHKQI